MRTRSDSRLLKQFLRQSWQLLAGLFLGLFGLVYVAWGATYNFYFNNTEQGDNGTATPNVVVSSDGKVTQSTPPGTEPGARPAADPAPPPPPEAASSASVAVAHEEPEAAFRKFRVAVGASVYKEYGPGASFTGMSQGLKLALSGSLFLSRDLALTVFGGKMPDNGDTAGVSADRWLMGAELELVPIHLGFGKLENFIELGVLAGIEAEYYQADTFSYGGYSGAVYSETRTSVGSQWNYRPEGGLRANLNLGNGWGLTSAIRATEYYATVETALAFRF